MASISSPRTAIHSTSIFNLIEFLSRILLLLLLTGSGKQPNSYNFTTSIFNLLPICKYTCISLNNWDIIAKTKKYFEKQKKNILINTKYKQVSRNILYPFIFHARLQCRSSTNITKCRHVPLFHAQKSRRFFYSWKKCRQKRVKLMHFLLRSLPSFAICKKYLHFFLSQTNSLTIKYDHMLSCTLLLDYFVNLKFSQEISIFELEYSILNFKNSWFLKTVFPIFGKKFVIIFNIFAFSRFKLYQSLRKI